jgi:hypothetical protein
MCLGRYSFGRWTIVEAILFFFLMPTFLRFLLKSLHGGKERKKEIYIYIYIYIVKEGLTLGEKKTKKGEKWS